MRILVVGALAWNPERILGLCDRGHELYGLWTRSMAWDQGPYPFTQDRVRDVRLAEGAALVQRGDVDLVYSLYMAYPPGLWDPQHGRDLPALWPALRVLLEARERGRRHVPFIRHWGSDTATFDPAVVAALDGHLFCNRELHDYLTAPVRAGGLGMTIACPPDRIAYLDSDLPPRAFMTDRYAAKLSASDGEVHTVCIGRPRGIDLLALARRGIHLDIYGNSVDAVARTLAESVRMRDLRPTCRAAERFVRVHPSRQVIGAGLDEIWRVKSSWVPHFSRYDAGWSYVNVHEPSRLADRALIPNRLGTYLLAGLPVITERRPGYHRYEAMRERGAGVEFEPGDYDELAGKLRDREGLRAAEARARSARLAYSFEATLDPLIAFFERIAATRATVDRWAAVPAGPRWHAWPARAGLRLARARARFRRRLLHGVAGLKVGYLAASLRARDRGAEPGPVA